MTMTPGNYLEHAAESWWQFEKHLKPQLTVLRDMFVDAIPIALKAPRFLLPHNGISITDNLTHLASPIRLPYPCTVLEYTQSFPDDDYAGKTVLIAQEVVDENGPDEIAVMGFWCGRNQRWIPIPWAICIDALSLPKDHDNCCSIRILDLFMERPATEDEFCANAGPMGRAAFVVMALIQALQCCNIETDIITPAEALNKKRVATGKLPFVEYKVLVLGDERSASTPQGGHHASPRQHLRRGHIRRISDNRTVWVNQCLVGNPNKGFIAKDYRVKA